MMTKVIGEPDVARAGGGNNKTVDEQDFDKVEGRVVITTSTDAIIWTETITPLTTTQMTDDTSERSHAAADIKLVKHKW